MVSTPIDGRTDIIDSRDVIDRIEELEAYFGEEITEKETELDPDDADLIEKLGIDFSDADDLRELLQLVALANEASNYTPDWNYGEVLINDDYFTEYAQELAEDLGLYPAENSSSWPLYCIDWDRAAEDLKMDYSQVEFDGHTFWVRS